MKIVFCLCKLIRVSIIIIRLFKECDKMQKFKYIKIENVKKCKTIWFKRRTKKHSNNKKTDFFLVLEIFTIFQKQNICLRLYYENQKPLKYALLVVFDLRFSSHLYSVCLNLWS